MSQHREISMAPGAQYVGEAPGRLDFMGGVADYSGSLVLQMPIRAHARVTVAAFEREVVRLHSDEETASVELPLGSLRALTGLDAGQMRRALDEFQVPQWTLYVVGCFLLFCQRQEVWPSGGLEFSVSSQVPVGAGVSSSAALEVATLRALEAWSGQNFAGTELARLAQRAENEIVGAPCGLMDQLASAHGQDAALLPILCRPDVLGAPIPLPAELRIVGWPSGVKHAVSDAPYATARTAAFMGKKILERHLGVSLGFATELTPSQVRAVDTKVLPFRLRGGEFLEIYGAIDDPLSSVDANREYPVRDGVLFPVEENFRCRLAAHLLQNLPPSLYEPTANLLGELMYQSHAGYTTIGLGCPETDTMVAAVRQLGPAAGFYGARISGVGSGGTVVVLLHRDSLPQLQALPHGKALEIIH